METNHKTALITGANKGIGFEIARQLGHLGFHVIVSGRDSSRTSNAVAVLTQEGVLATPLVMDVGEVNSIHTAFEAVKDEVKTLNVIVNNAAILIGEHKPMLNFQAHEIQQTFSINALGPFFVSQTFLPLLPRGGRIINISSGAGSICSGVDNYAPIYSASKTAENALTLHLANALKSRGIAVNLVCPGWVRTDMGGRMASRSVAKGAETPVWLATEASEKLTGKFFRDKKEITL